MIRSRDLVALLAALVLTRMAWNDTTESLHASVHLAFFYARDRASAMSPMDVDGDGTNEALAVIQQSSKNDDKHWEWKILDLKSLSPRTGRFTNRAMPPFQPSVLLSYDDVNRDASVTPLQIVTGQVLVKTTGMLKQKMDTSLLKKDIPVDERNRHYFCGESWHDAAQKCSQPCPGGQATECPDDQRCYADTPCNIEDASRNENTQILFELTPGGGLPSIVTLWSDGMLAMTSITNDSEKKATGSSLELKFMWKVQLLPDVPHPLNILWNEYNVVFLDAYDSSGVTGAEHGMIIVSGVYADGGTNTDNELIPIPFLVAIEALSGKVIWDRFDDSQKAKEQIPLPVARGTSSYARRRSRVASLSDEVAIGHPQNLPDCQVTFRRHLNQALPYSYWTANDSHLAAVHLDQSKKRHHHSKEKEKSHPVIGKDVPKLSTPKKKWHHKFHKPKHAGPVKGQPNVLVVHNKGGLQIRSLRNGYPLCHMSLLHETLYADLNNDGALDQVQILIPRKDVDERDEWIGTLLTKLETRKDAKSRSNSKTLEDAARGGVSQGSHLCHALALSGVPAREELFSTSLCSMSHDIFPALASADLDTVSPIVVESLSGRRNTRDVIVALNNGMVHRLQGRTGRKEWSFAGKQHDNFPLWESSSVAQVVLARVQSPPIPPPIRPIVIVGENSLAVISVKNGSLLAKAPFPQTSIARPILADCTGDGITDVIVLSADGIWGYQIQIQDGRPVVLRILVGLLIFSLMLAVLRNRFGGERKDTRATDL